MSEQEKMQLAYDLMRLADDGGAIYDLEIDLSESDLEILAHDLYHQERRGK